MAKGGGELSGLRKTAAAYVRRMIRLGLAAQTLSSAGGRQLAISRLISSGIALATQLQRGLVVRVVGAPLVRRRPQRRSRGASPEEYPEPSPASLTETAALDQEATGWEDAVPLSLALAEIESQPFSLARALPSVVAAQQSTFRALSSVNVAVARAVGSTSFAPMTSRASPSSTSLEPVPRGSPDAFPEGQATGFSEAPALAVGAAFRGGASSMVFNLSSAVHEMTNLTLGTQAVGAGFAPQQPRVANEGTGFASSSPGPTSPSLLQQSITGSVDTSFRSSPPSVSNLGLVSSGGGSSSSPWTAQPSSSADFPLSREPNPASDLSAGVGGPLGVSPRGPAPSSPAAAGAELNAGPYAVPNGFNSVFFSPAFAAGSELFIQVRSLASAGPPSRLPLRASEEAPPPPRPALGMGVVPEQYPSSYPAGAAYSVSGIVASLGLVERAFSSAATPGFGGAGGGLAREEAPGMEDAAETVGGAFVGESLDARGSATSASSVAPAETAPSEPDLVAEEGGRAGVPTAGLDANVQAGIPRAEPFHYRRVFGERWLASLAEAAAMGRAMMSGLMASGGSPSTSALLPKASHAGAPGFPFAAGAPGLQPPSTGAGLVSGPASAAQGGAAGPAQVTPERTGLSGRAIAPGEPERGTEWQEIGPPQSALQPLDSAPSAQPREPAAMQARNGGPSGSVWEAVTRFPGILTPSVASPRVDQGRTGPRVFQEPRSTVRSQTVVALPFEISSSPAALGALQLASSVRNALAAASSAVLGAPAPAYSSPGQRGVERLAPTLESAAALLERSAGPSLKPATRARPGQIGRFAASTERQVHRGVEEAGSASAFAVSNLPALQAVVTSRSLLAARVTGTAARASSLAGAAMRSRPDAVKGLTTTEAASVSGAAPPLYGQHTRRDGASVPPQAAKGTAWREIRAPLSGAPAGLSSPHAELPLGATSSPAHSLSHASVEEGPAAEKHAIQVAPPSAGGELDAAVASTPLGRGAEPERVFFGLDVVAQALSLASKVPSAAALNATVVAAHPRIGRRTASAVERQSERKATPEAKYQVEQSPLLLEGWRSAPEEAMNKMLGEPPRQAPGPSVEPAAEPDERELRRRIEKMIDEELRRYGYQP